MEVSNLTTKQKCVLHFKSVDFLGRDAHKVEGYMYDSNNKKLRAFYGKWLEALYSYEVPVYENYLKTIRRSPSPFAIVKTPSEVIPSRGSSSNLNLANQKLLWEARPRPESSNKYYNFTEFALTLNELGPSISHLLPRTDSRFRPDIRFMEEGDIERAASEKTRIEEKQRVSKKERKHLKEDWEPRWFIFKKDHLTGNEEWIYDGNYWNRDYKECHYIF